MLIWCWRTTSARRSTLLSSSTAKVSGWDRTILAAVGHNFSLLLRWLKDFFAPHDPFALDPVVQAVAQELNRQ